MKYRAEIDGLRALAVVPVILFHAGFEIFSGGFVGVDVFFVISGYLITTILIADIENNRFSIVNFYERRARRILPALYLVVFSTIVASFFILYPEDLVSFAKSVVAVPIFSSNFFFWSERGYFGGATEFKPLVHTWSLAVEEQFYILFPIFLLLLKKYRRIFYSLLSLIFLLSISSSYYVTLLHFDTAFYFPVTRAWELLFGSFGALLLRYKTFTLKNWVADLIAIIGLGLIFYSYTNFDSNTLFPYVNALIPVVGTFLFIITAQHSIFVKNFLSSHIIVYVGLISFSLYLWHQPLFALARHLDLFNGNVAFLIVATFVFSYLSYAFVEKPFRDRNRISKRKVFLWSIVSSLILVSLGFVTISKLGFPNRFKAEDREILTQLANYKGYNQARFDRVQFKQFEENSKYKVAIVGDSYAKDLLNIIVESGMFDDYEFSSRHINAECGNLYLGDYDLLDEFIQKSKKVKCKFLGRYEGEEFLKILNDANEIWVVASWSDWTVEFLPTSIENLNRDFEKPIRVFGNKNFGRISPYSLLAVPYDQRVNYSQTVNERSLNISSLLNQKLSDYEYFYPLLDVLCGGKSSECRVFTRNGLLMSADGGHLTREGAIEAALRMSNTLNRIRTSR